MHAASSRVGHSGIAFTFGLIVLALIYIFGDISGAHFNPALTAAFAGAGCASRAAAPPGVPRNRNQAGAPAEIPLSQRADFHLYYAPL